MAIRSHYSSTLVKRIEELRGKIVTDLAAGCAADFPDYRQLVGRVQGLGEVIMIMDDLDAEISGE